MGWNHRVMAHEEEDSVYLQIHEVYYDKNGVPESYTSRPVTVGGETTKTMTWSLNKMKECLKKPVLYAGAKFPDIYNQSKPIPTTLINQFVMALNDILKFSERKGICPDPFEFKIVSVTKNVAIDLTISDGKKTVRLYTIIAEREIQKKHFRLLIK